ncbi:MAG: hypothetical protein ACI9AT_001725 [Ulvibacter sp.]|jgi:hypothetical protein
MGRLCVVFNQNELLLLNNHFDQANANKNTIEDLSLPIFGAEN